MLLLLLSFSINSHAQSFQLTGKTTDNQSSHSMSYVTVSIHNLTDTTLVNGGISDEKGLFNLSDIPESKPYLFKASFIGYQTIFQKVDFSNTNFINLGEIKLSPTAELLDGVEVNLSKYYILKEHVSDILFPKKPRLMRTTKQKNHQLHSYQHHHKVELKR